jgi:hypothetical protein
VSRDIYVDIAAMFGDACGLGQYILDGHTPVEEHDPLAWGRWLKTHERHVARHRSADGWYISTLFIGLDMRLLPSELLGLPPSPPLLFETMAFAPDRSIQAQRRCATWDEAVLQHAEVCAEVEARGVTLTAWRTPDNAGRRMDA